MTNISRGADLQRIQMMSRRPPEAVQMPVNLVDTVRPTIICRTSGCVRDFISYSFWWRVVTQPHRPTGRHLIASTGGTLGNLVELRLVW